MVCSSKNWDKDKGRRMKEATGLRIRRKEVEFGFLAWFRWIISLFLFFIFIHISVMKEMMEAIEIELGQCQIESLMRHTMVEDNMWILLGTRNPESSRAHWLWTL